MTIQNHCRVKACGKNLSRQHFMCLTHMEMVPPEMLLPIAEAVRMVKQGPRPTRSPDPENQALLQKWKDCLDSYVAGQKAAIEYVNKLLDPAADETRPADPTTESNP